MLSVVIAYAIGLLLGAALRPLVFALSVPHGEPARRTCPHCELELAPAVASAIVRAPAGRCRRCRARVGPGLAGPELLTAFFFALIAWTNTLSWSAATQYWLAALGVALALIDTAVQRLPDALTIPATLGTLALLTAATAAHEDGSLPRAAAAAATLGIAGYLLALTGPGFGLGDAKLLPAFGALLGWTSWGAVLWGVFAGFALCALTGAVLILSRIKGRRSHMAFGPFLISGAVGVSLLVS